MAQRQHFLHELLQEDQEPFLLKNYIADRRCQLKRTTPKPHQRHLQQVNKRKPISQPNTSSNVFPQNFCRNACFFSFNNASPDPRKSPFFEFQSPAKSPGKSPNAIFLHIPARTATLLLEAALRIQKQSCSTKTKPQHHKGTSFGLFGSFLKKLTHPNNNKTRKQLKPTTTLKAAASDHHEVRSFACSCNDGRPSSAVWSESNEGISLDASSCTSQSEEDLERSFEFIKQVVADHHHHEIIDFGSYDEHFCESPFHFELRRSPSSDLRTPDFSSPATSPSRHFFQDKENDDTENKPKFQQEKEEQEQEEYEEDKEQFSPVSVLDPPFEDDDDGHDGQSEGDGFDIECSYAIVERAKQQLLQKLRRFEKLAELDPVELEKRMLEQEQEDDGDYENDMNDLENENDDLVLSDGERNIDSTIMDELSKTSLHPLRKIPGGMERLVSDLINEEERQQNNSGDGEAAVERAFRKLESWKYVEFNTIDMMVEQDLKTEIYAWKRCQEQPEETAFQIELGIFQLLVEELAEELVH